MQDSTDKLELSSGAVTAVSNAQAVDIFEKDGEKTSDEQRKKLEKKEKDNQRFAIFHVRILKSGDSIIRMLTTNAPLHCLSFLYFLN